MPFKLKIDFQIVIALLLPVMLFIVGTVGYHIIEGWSFFDSFYMTTITVATVGYSEIMPMSHTGRIFTSIVILSGVIIIAYCIQTFVMYMLQKNLFGTLWRRRMEARIKNLKNHIIVCGYGKIGRHVCRHLMDEGVPFIVIDRVIPEQEQLSDDGMLFIEGECTDETLLKEAGIDKAKTLVAVVGSDADNLFITMTARGLNPGIQIVARAEDMANRKKFMRGGADKVILPYELGGRRIAAQVLHPTVADFLETVMFSENIELRMADVIISGKSNLVGKTLMNSDIRKLTGTIIVAIKKMSGALINNPMPETQIDKDDTVICLGTQSQIESFQRLAGGK